jgi:hypothetical protein
VTKLGAAHVQAAFLEVLRWPGVCVTTPDWDPRWGIGRVDLLALLQAPLPRRADLQDVKAFGADDGPFDRLAATVGVRPAVVRTRLAAVLGAADQGELADLVEMHEGELVYLAMTDAAFLAALTEPQAVGAFAPEVAVEGVSEELGARLAG